MSACCCCCCCTMIRVCSSESSRCGRWGGCGCRRQSADALEGCPPLCVASPASSIALRSTLQQVHMPKAVYVQMCMSSHARAGCERTCHHALITYLHRSARSLLASLRKPAYARPPPPPWCSPGGRIGCALRRSPAAPPCGSASADPGYLAQT
jgi:hypothetical protein